MRANLKTAALAAVVTILLSGPAWATKPPIPGDYQALVCDWYLRYLGRPADVSGLETNARKLMRGFSPREVEASILGSREYFVRNGSTKIGYIRGLFRDVLGTEPAPGQLEYWLEELSDIGYRDDLAEDFLEKVRKRNPLPPPPQVYVVPNRVIVASPPVAVPQRVRVEPPPVIVIPAPAEPLGQPRLVPTGEPPIINTTRPR